MHGDLGAFAFFGFLAAVIIVPQVLKSRDRQRMFDTMRSAYDRGQPVPPELVDAMTRRGRDVDPLDYIPESAPSRDLRRGIVCVAVGVGLFLMGGVFYAGLYNDGGAVETLMAFAASGAIPFCIGVAFLGLWFFNRRSARAGARSPMTPPVAPPMTPQGPSSVPPPGDRLQF